MISVIDYDKPLFEWNDLDDPSFHCVHRSSDTNGNSSYMRKNLDQYNPDTESVNGASHTIILPVRVSDNILSSQNSFFMQLQNAIDEQEIVEIIDKMEFTKIADRLRYLQEVTIDDHPDDPAMHFDSLKEMALFFSLYGKVLPYPQIGICSDGTLQIEWHATPASAVINFMLDGSVEFAGILENRDPPLRVQGSGSKEIAMQVIRPILRAIP
ncbi:MAG: hypothetical protein OXF08_03905 [Bacteroidetes bacterium]|nr:hypothetical protein [Bacteroidota bacterium]